MTIVAAPAFVSTAAINDPPPQGMERPPAHWGDPRIYELRGSYWWCTRCWKCADGHHVFSVSHRRNVRYYSGLSPPDVRGDLPSGAGLTASASSTLVLALQPSAEPNDAPPAASSADDVCPDVWELQWDAMYPGFVPNPETASRRPPTERTDVQAPPPSAGLDLNWTRPTCGHVCDLQRNPKCRRVWGGPCWVDAGPHLMCVCFLCERGQELSAP